jgi:hypothetical protein
LPVVVAFPEASTVKVSIVPECSVAPVSVNVHVVVPVPPVIVAEVVVALMPFTWPPALVTPMLMPPFATFSTPVPVVLGVAPLVSTDRLLLNVVAPVTPSVLLTVVAPLRLTAPVALPMVVVPAPVVLMVVAPVMPVVPVILLVPPATPILVVAALVVAMLVVAPPVTLCWLCQSLGRRNSR